MRKMLIVGGGVVVLGLVGFGGWYVLKGGHLLDLPHIGIESPIQEVPVPSLTETYRNETFHLSFKYPAGYTVREIPTELATTILIERESDQKGIQIYITPYKDTDTTITAERVQNEVPDIEVNDPQPIILGSAGEGLAFKSNNEDFGGDSREAWFIIAGNLYQISTYAEYDGLLKAIFATWSFF